jgi:uncharacterized PurR-regulated membrane protein YhhQ (DUF165 family)
MIVSPQNTDRWGWAFFAGFIATIWLANWLIVNVGLCPPPGVHEPCVIPVWPWPLIMAPSGVLAIGLGFTLRDLVQRRLGIPLTMIAIVVGAALSAYLSPALALASGSAFFLSELLDLFVYTPLQKRHLTAAVVGSNLVGLTVDSVVFLFLAFGSLAFLPGQIIGKLWMTLLALPIIWFIRKKGW